VIRLLAATIGLLGLAVGCGEHKPSADQPRAKVFELAIYYPLERQGYIGTGTSLREIDPDTLAPLTRHGLRLGGNSEGLAFSPDRREAAFGIDFGEVVFVDLRDMRVRDRLRLGKVDWLVRPIGWPRRDLLYALGCTYQGKYGCVGTRLLMIDPTVPRQIASFDLGGGAEGRYDPASARAVVLVAPTGFDNGYGVRPARLLILEPTGAVDEIELTRILVGKTKRRFGPHTRSDALVLDRGRAIVIGSRGLIAEVGLRSRRLSYHRVPELSVSRVRLSRARAEPWMGTVNPSSDEEVYVVRAWPGTFVVTSSRSQLGDQGERISVRRSSRAHLLDTSAWSTRPWNGGYAKAAGGTLIVSRTARPYRGPTTILAYERSGAIQYRLRFPGPVTYSTFGNRLYVGGIDGRTTRIFDARTGRLLHRRSPTEVQPAFTWTPPG
jgi:hypothetical protein